MPKYDFTKVAKLLFEITLQHGCSPVDLLHTFRALFPRNTSVAMLLSILLSIYAL